MVRRCGAAGADGAAVEVPVKFDSGEWAVAEGTLLRLVREALALMLVSVCTPEGLVVGAAGVSLFLSSEVNLTSRISPFLPGSVKSTGNPLTSIVKGMRLVAAGG